MLKASKALFFALVSLVAIPAFSMYDPDLSSPASTLRYIKRQIVGNPCRYSPHQLSELRELVCLCLKNISVDKGLWETAIEFNDPVIATMVCQKTDDFDYKIEYFLGQAVRTKAAQVLGMLLYKYVPKNDRPRLGNSFVPRPRSIPILETAFIRASNPEILVTLLTTDVIAALAPETLAEYVKDMRSDDRCTKLVEIYENNTPAKLFQYCLEYNLPYAIKMLVENRNFNPNAPDQDGLTPLGHALALGKFECIEALVEQGADVNQSYLGLRPLQIAQQLGNKDITNYLILKGAELPKAPKASALALTLAAAAAIAQQSEAEARDIPQTGKGSPVSESESSVTLSAPMLPTATSAAAAAAAPSAAMPVQLTASAPKPVLQPAPAPSKPAAPKTASWFGGWFGGSK